MRRIILSVLMVVMVTTPCLAGEIEPDELFSIEGTKWQILPIQLMIFPFPWIGYDADYNFAFYAGEVYAGYEQYLTRWRDNAFYRDMPACSIFITGYSVNSISTQQTAGSVASHFGIMQPAIGIGVLITKVCCITATNIPMIAIALLSKTDDNWTPSEIPPAPVFISISPNQGEQGTTLTDVIITGANTNFESEFPLITFSPSDGLTRSNISVISNTEIEFDLKIADDAPVGFRNVEVHGKEYIIGNDVFEVLENN